MLAIFNHTGRLIYDADTGIKYHYIAADGDNPSAIFFTFPTGHTDDWHGEAADPAWRQLAACAIRNQADMPPAPSAATVRFIDRYTPEREQCSP